MPEPRTSQSLRVALRRSPVRVGLLVTCVLLSCAPSSLDEQRPEAEICLVTLALQQPEPIALARPLHASDVTIDRIGPTKLFPGGILFLTGTHLGGDEGVAPVLLLRGQFHWTDGPPLPVSGTLVGQVTNGGRRAAFQLEPAKLEAWSLTGAVGRFHGTATLVVELGEPQPPAESSVELTFELVTALTPTLEQLSVAALPGVPLEVYPEDRLTLVARDLLLPGEGQLELLLDGTQQRSGMPAGAVRHVLPVTAEAQRDDGTVLLAAEALGIAPGTFRGQAQLRATTLTGAVWESASQEVELRIQLPLLAGLDPPAASRGQWISLIGRGFVPSSDRGGTLFRLDGTFTPDNGDQPVELNRYELYPERYLDNGRLQYPLRTETIRNAHGEKLLTGLTATPGRFQGTITPIINWDRTEVRGIPFADGFVIAPTRQVVYIKYLPGFTISLNDTFGLANVEREVRQRILEVVHRDYAQFNVVFQEQRPEDFLEYMVIEVGGLDPNGQDLFGLDNTTGEDDGSPKDVGNLRLQEVIGGKNARAEEQGYLAYGGVFLESFRQFSTQLANPISLASPRFDEIFSDIAPFLCGEGVTPDEYPGGPRSDKIAEAIWALSNLVGNTISHEVGHALGLSLPHGPPFEYHNLFGTPNAMMDSGADRPFEERAELDGQGPAVFEPENVSYLREILPRAVGR